VTWVRSFRTCERIEHKHEHEHEHEHEIRVGAQYVSHAARAKLPETNMNMNTNTRKRTGPGCSSTVQYSAECCSYRVLPACLPKTHQIQTINSSPNLNSNPRTILAIVSIEVIVAFQCFVDTMTALQQIFCSFENPAQEPVRGRAVPVQGSHGGCVRGATVASYGEGSQGSPRCWKKKVRDSWISWRGAIRGPWLARRRVPASLAAVSFPDGHSFTDILVGM